MLYRENRLKKKKDFDKVFKKGKTIAGKLIFLKVIKNKLKISRFGFIVSLKLSKKAVIRNKLRRQLREITRKELSNIRPGFDMIIVAKPEIINKNYQDIKSDLENLFKIL